MLSTDNIDINLCVPREIHALLPFKQREGFEA